MLTDDPFLSDVVIPDTPCPPARCTLAEWWEEARTLDHLRFLTEDKEVAEAVKDWHEARQSRHAYAGNSEVVKLAQSGKRFTEIADLLGCTVEQVAWPLARTAEDVPRIIAVEAYWRDHPEASQAEIARATGESKKYVRSVIVRLGGTPDSTRRLRQGGGRKYSAETYETIRKMREAGASYREIANEVGLQRATVAKMCTRRGYRPKVAAAT